MAGFRMGAKERCSRGVWLDFSADQPTAHCLHHPGTVKGRISHSEQKHPIVKAKESRLTAFTRLKLLPCSLIGWNSSLSIHSRSCMFWEHLLVIFGLQWSVFHCSLIRKGTNSLFVNVSEHVFFSFLQKNKGKKITFVMTQEHNCKISQFGVLWWCQGRAGPTYGCLAIIPLLWWCFLLGLASGLCWRSAVSFYFWAVSSGVLACHSVSPAHSWHCARRQEHPLWLCCINQANSGSYTYYLLLLL